MFLPCHLWNCNLFIPTIKKNYSNTQIANGMLIQYFNLVLNSIYLWSIWAGFIILNFPIRILKQFISLTFHQIYNAWLIYWYWHKHCLIFLRIKSDTNVVVPYQGNALSWKKGECVRTITPTLIYKFTPTQAIIFIHRCDPCFSLLNKTLQLLTQIGR